MESCVFFETCHTTWHQTTREIWMRKHQMQQRVHWPPQEQIFPIQFFLFRNSWKRSELFQGFFFPSRSEIIEKDELSKAQHTFFHCQFHLWVRASVDLTLPVATPWPSQLNMYHLSWKTYTSRNGRRLNVLLFLYLITWGSLNWSDPDWKFFC